ncbi:hypothetical protein O3Q52_39325, partial [Streptomyces sp. ActVer]|nr:hypothetical protein [Streptomyces sp. ActVer]
MGLRDTGRVTEPALPGPEGEQSAAAKEFGGLVRVRCVDAGSCNGCEIEIAAPSTRSGRQGPAS